MFFWLFLSNLDEKDRKKNAYISEIDSYCLGSNLLQKIQQYAPRKKWYFCRNNEFLNFSQERAREHKVSFLFISMRADFYVHNKEHILEKCRDLSRWYKGTIVFALEDTWGDIAKNSQDMDTIISIQKDCLSHFQGDILFSKFILDYTEDGSIMSYMKSQIFYTLAIKCHGCGYGDKEFLDKNTAPGSKNHGNNGSNDIEKSSHITEGGIKKVEEVSYGDGNPNIQKYSQKPQDVSQEQGSLDNNIPKDSPKNDVSESLEKEKFLEEQTQKGQEIVNNLRSFS